MPYDENVEEKRTMVSKDHPKLSIADQCKLLELNRSTYYYVPSQESELNLELMRLIDEHYLEFPEKGAHRMHTWLTMDKGKDVNIKRIERLYYDVMGLRAISPGPHTSKRNKEHPVFPYLLKNLKIDRSNQVWACDISYIPMKKGFMYLYAIIDVYSRYIVGWSLSNTMESSWCAETLKLAMEKWGNPEILNTDQGSQFTAQDFIDAVLPAAKLSMDGKGRATDNAFVERFWRSLKYEKLYMSPASSVLELWNQINQ